TNDPITARDDTATTTEDNSVSGNVLTNDRAQNVDGPTETLTVTGNTQPAHGTVTIAPDGSYTYSPALNYNSPHQFTYTASDGTSTSTGTVSITVTPVNDAPVANPDGPYTATNGGLVLGQLTSIASGNVLTNDTDVDGDPLKAELVSGPTLSGGLLPSLISS